MLRQRSFLVIGRELWRSHGAMAGLRLRFSNTPKIEDPVPATKPPRTPLVFDEKGLMLIYKHTRSVRLPAGVSDCEFDRQTESVHRFHDPFFPQSMCAHKSTTISRLPYRFSCFATFLHCCTTCGRFCALPRSLMRCSSPTTGTISWSLTRSAGG